jgi:hypothetical protein
VDFLIFDYGLTDFSIFFCFREQLAHVIEAANFFLTISNESIFQSFSNITSTFPTLNLAHIKHFLDMYSASDHPVPIPQRVRAQIDKACAQQKRLGKMPLFLPEKLSLTEVNMLVASNFELV